MADINAKMLEILKIVYALPIGYRKLRRERIIEQYEKHLISSERALNYFYDMMGKERPKNNFWKKGL